MQQPARSNFGRPLFQSMASGRRSLGYSASRLRAALPAHGRNDCIGSLCGCHNKHGDDSGYARTLRSIYHSCRRIHLCGRSHARQCQHNINRRRPPAIRDSRSRDATHARLYGSPRHRYPDDSQPTGRISRRSLQMPDSAYREQQRSIRRRLPEHKTDR